MRVLDDRGSVRTDEILTLPHSYCHRAALTGGDDPVAVATLDYRYRIGANGFLESEAHGFLKRTTFGIADILYKVDEHFRVSLAPESDAFGCQRFLQDTVILDDAVVDHRDASVRREMRMRISVVRLAVRGPTGMGNTYRSGSIFVSQEVFQGIDLALAFVDIETAILSDQRHSGTVITAVFESPEAFHEYGAGLPATHVTNYTTHSSTPILWLQAVWKKCHSTLCSHL